MKVLIADDHPLVRDALARTLQPLLPDALILQAADLTPPKRSCWLNSRCWCCWICTCRACRACRACAGCSVWHRR